ncbi:MAG: 50S ribosomal protein L6 [Patescibacteria group bacterium]|jgi:large subunit ribosomal protein L6
MSRLGKLPIELPAGTEVKLQGGFIYVKGPKGELKEKVHEKIKLELGDKEVKVSVANPEEKSERSLWGMFRGLVKNMVDGVNKGFEKKLEISGVGYRAAVSGNKLIVNAGYSHPVEFVLPEGISAKVEGNVITLSGIDKYRVGESAAQVRRIRKPEPYKGKGIKYSDEILRRKAGKTAAK